MAVVTISRQTGSRGDEIAALLAKKMNHELIDDEKIHSLAESCDDEYKDACSAYEMEKFQGFFERLSFNRPAYKSLFESLNLELAGRDNVVLLGRGVQVVLKEFPGIFHARIVAPDELRIKQIASEQKLSERAARDLMHSQDTQRSALIQSIYKIDLNDFELYDMVINTADFTVEAAADLIAQGIRKKAESATQALPADEMQRMAFAKRLESHIRKKVETLPFMEGIQVSARAGGEITLVGFVSGEQDLKTAQTIAESYPEVCKVDNRLSVVSGL
jgi:cytidylate kinase